MPTTARFVFHGTLRFGVPPEAETGRTVVLKRTSASAPVLDAIVPSPTETYEVNGRPTRSDVDALTELLREGRIERLVAIGDGALIDGAKLAAIAARGDGAAEPRMTLVPAGREPYRAVTSFAVIDEGGERPTSFDDRLATGDVLVLPEVLEQMDMPTAALVAADTAAMSVESLLSLRSDPLSRAMALSALRTVGRSSGEAQGRTRAALVSASFLTAEAFWVSRLGIAHAIGSPLGTRCGMTHDALHAILSPHVVRHWGDDADGMAEASAALSASGAAGVAHVLDDLRSKAGLPGTLEELGIRWDDVLAVLPTSFKSSGIASLPRPLDASGLESIARLAWGAPPRKEGARAGT
jgi:alcohol dehydrogenase class IV